MRELIALHEKILALPKEQRYLCGVDWYGSSSWWRETGIDEEAVGSLPEHLQAGFHALTSAIQAVMAEGFTFRAFAGYDEEDTPCPRFRLFSQAGGKASDSQKGDFVPDRSLIEQLRELSWEEQRVKAAEHKQNLEAVVDVLEQLTRAANPAEIPRPSRSRMTIPKNLNDFFREARADVSRIHVLYAEKVSGQTPVSLDTATVEEWRALWPKYVHVSFDTVGELREGLPGLAARSEDISTVVAWGTVFSGYFLENMRRYGRRFAMTSGLGME